MNYEELIFKIIIMGWLCFAWWDRNRLQKQINTLNSEKPIYLSACENKFKLNTNNSKGVNK